MADLNKLAVGDKILIKNGAYNISPWNNGAPNGTFASFVYTMEFTIMQVGLGSDKDQRTNYIAFGIPGKGYTGAIAAEDIKEVTYSASASTAKVDPNKNKPNEESKSNAKNGDNKKTDDESVWDHQNLTKPTVSSAGDESYVVYNGQKIGGGNGDGKSNIGNVVGVKYPDANRFGKGSQTSGLGLGTISNDSSTVKKNKEEFKVRVTPNENGGERIIEGNPNSSLDLDDPLIVRSKYKYIDSGNSGLYPQRIEIKDAKGRITRLYDYTIDISKLYDPSSPEGAVHNSLKQLDYIESLHGIPTAGRREAFKNRVENYFRFRRVPNPNSKLAKGFAHIFFTRPDLNILNYDGDGKYSLPIACESDSSIYYAYRNNIHLLRELVLDNGMTHDFMFMLSNAAGSFSILEDVLSTDTWGSTWTGHSITYGKHNHDNKIGGEFAIDYTDDRNLNIYHLHKLWIDYIAKVYRGELIPRGMTLTEKGYWKPAVGPSSRGNGGAYSYAANKILDYASSLYYILTAEDGESIIFWTKYYGVFPVNAPSGAFDWASGEPVKNPKLNIRYKYSFKQDYEPYNLAEFNWLSNLPDKKKYEYMPIYNPTLLGPGANKVGVPFIETVVSDNADEPYQFKLRFRPPEQNGTNMATGNWINNKEAMKE